MIATGLLWYDDDTHHSLARKLADAAERYRERVGFEPTSCQLNPALIPAAPTAAAGGQARRARAHAAEPAIALRLIPDEHLRPNYFFVGVEAGEPALRVPGWRAEDDDEYDHAPRPATKSAKPQKPQIAAKTATASRTAPRSAGMAAAPSINVEKPAESATPTGPSKRQKSIPASVEASGGRPLAAGRSRARAQASQSNPPARLPKPAESATAIPGKNGSHHLPAPRGRGIGREVIPPASRRPTLPSDSRQKRQPPRATSGKNGNHQSGSSELTAETATAIKPARAATTQKPAKSPITSVPRSTAPRSPRTGVAKATTPKSAAATVPASAPAKPKLRSHADAAKPAKTATAPAGKLTLIPPQIATKSRASTPPAQPTQPALPATTRKARITAKTATEASPSPRSGRSRKTTKAAESATSTSAQVPTPSKRARKAAKTAITQHPAAREATTPRPSPRRRASRPEAIQARFQPPASTAANVATATKPTQLPRKPAKTATTPRTLAPSPAQATLWDDAPVPAHPVRKRRSA